MSRVRWWLFLFMLSGSLAAQQRTPFVVGSIVARPGSTASGYLEIPRGVDSATVVPVTIIHGATAGPVLTLVAGNHGYEYSPILALNRLPASVDPQQLSGTLILVHIANLPSFLLRTVYYNPWDWKNLNRVYPGKAGGTVTERIAYAITREVIERCDYLVDLHCGDGNESLRPYTYWMRIENSDVDEQSKRMALAFGLDHIVIDTERPRDPMNSVFCSNTAATRGKPSITIESGGLGSMEEHWIANIERGILSLMRHLKMVEGTPTYVEHPIWIDRGEVLRSTVTGVFWPKVGRSEFVQKGTLLGVITDFFGRRIAEVRSPLAGVVLYILGTPPINTGEPLAFIGRVVEQQ